MKFFEQPFVDLAAKLLGRRNVDEPVPEVFSNILQNSLRFSGSNAARKLLKQKDPPSFRTTTSKYALAFTIDHSNKSEAGYEQQKPCGEWDWSTGYHTRLNIHLLKLQTCFYARND
ncbi:hypothetical protein SAMN05421850_105259 [Lutimaribacter saemankumensis]|uniref:Uncharacterized protein n=1 Tax=Lutimaribacter saemankumensis TaxID=490829 RepID=A0A1G8NM90_9RHOB|nr:hypothetical protein SAMN05421850_105259 [Lutimaribacter saemankumensis]